MEQSKPIGKTDQTDSPLFNSKEEAERGSPTPRNTCNYQGSEYSQGAHVCINHDDYQCGSSGWFKTGAHC